MSTTQLGQEPEPVSTHREHQYHVEPQPLEVLHNLASSSANDDSDDNSNNSNNNTIGSSYR
jgi:hypothetical protein